jgi:hypothetical protein
MKEKEREEEEHPDRGMCGRDAPAKVGRCSGTY